MPPRGLPPHRTDLPLPSPIPHLHPPPPLQAPHPPQHQPCLARVPPRIRSAIGHRMKRPRASAALVLPPVYIPLLPSCAEPFLCPLPQIGSDSMAGGFASMVARGDGIHQRNPHLLHVPHLGLPPQPPSSRARACVGPIFAPSRTWWSDGASGRSP
ncbi:hypothetical protein ZWY2020_052573 [Hordeum vulgare]|nr:hypothetical protein ZWY2020_052573 [Hordeum vulgare]